MNSDEMKDRVKLAIQDLPEAVRRGIIHPDYRHNDPVLPKDLQTTMTSAEAYGQGAATFWKSFPDMTSDIVWLVVEDDKSATRWVSRGTFTGDPFFGVPPSGKSIEFTGLTMWRWVDGQVVEGITLFDSVTFNQQIAS